MEALALLAGIAAGFIGAWYYLRLKMQSERGIPADIYNALDKEKCLLEQELRMIRCDHDKALEEARHSAAEIVRLNRELSQWERDHKHLSERINSQKEEFETLNVKMQQQFENIASKIVLDNSQRIQQQHKDKLDDMLNPLKEKIEKFESRVKETHEERIREHQSLKEQILQLQHLNKTIGDEARNLTSALKGQSKTQGNWGELILEKVLQRSGLTRGTEYEIQSSLVNEEGRRQQPDVIIHLPDNKHLVIDSKASLVSYERYYNTDSEEEKLIFLKEHLASLRKHVKDLNSKNYQQLYNLNTLDFVLMFIPVESAFSLAVESDAELFNDAFEKNIVIVTTSTLLATLRTISNIWRIELQNRNALEIARQGGQLYDKFASLLDDLITLGNRLKSTQDCYQESMKKLHTGQGNLISRVHKIKMLGLKTSKSVPQQLLDRTEDVSELADVNDD